jgi:hypothetical protein
MKDNLIVIACATVIEEMLPLMPEGMKYRTLDFGLHSYPNKLRSTLQDNIDQVVHEYRDLDEAITILLGYGLCSQGIAGIQARGCRLVVPRVDDCIAIFLGSRAAYKQQALSQPGTYYLTKGWIEAGDTPFSEYRHVVRQFGEKRAESLFKSMLANYKRLALINTGQYQLEHYREYSRRMAERFNLCYEEIQGSTKMVEKILSGQWDNDFIVAEPGDTITLTDFLGL